ncbi:MAG: DUF4492 domain-containing protein [Bacteroidetes bacterium CG02_land_8_20_14_3_00_31_25]|nr:DUF4492 domain-containing protein [Bacteroidota bacterium]PIV62670.1 MAG: DUF4492 domain-containing protein [Bacteroidetes bacterium CG02_land_8_20_14_3_00_31_25]PIX33526.1 MAG: DUF4492 domain-containing protein [Bacteroidetes bacterium CG_4_8_14_3_um_filter_31_14]PIY04056.1 MAG: DUF4492 domain-containing protein [Bacteroidetes bacterium CG_4_10_14_3_um_filter_31_20]
MSNLLKNIGNFYLDGFKNMSILNKKLWLIIFIKLFIMFAILKVFFFQDFLKSNFDNNRQRSEYIINSLTEK